MTRAMGTYTRALAGNDTRHMAVLALETVEC